MGELAEFWNGKRVTANHKHHVSALPEKKQKDHVARIAKHLFPHVHEANSIIDWGCGGGLLAKAVLGHYKPNNLYLVDISAKTLEIAAEYVGAGTPVLIPDKPTINDLPKSKIDMIMCYSVIQHFPTLNYWERVAALWNKLKPQHIVGQIKLANTISQAGSGYYSGRNYLNGLLLNKQALMKVFPTYNLKYWSTTKQVANNQSIAFFVLSKA